MAVVVVTNAAIAPLLLPAQTPSAGAAHPPRAAAVPRRGLALPKPPITRTTDTVCPLKGSRRPARLWTAKGRLRGKQPKLTPRQEQHLVALHAAGQHTSGELAELFGVARSTVYRALERAARPGVEPAA